jgi:excisionase family DNA binding protein
VIAVAARPSPYLTAKEAAVYLRFPSVKALYQALRIGTIPAWCVCRRGRCFLFDTRALDQWLSGESNVRTRRFA